MNNYQANIIWLGLILIALNVIVNIGSFKSTLFGGTSSGSVPAPATQNPPLAPGPLGQTTPPNVSVA